MSNRLHAAICLEYTQPSYSSLKIVMALSDAWHINKCKYFLLDEKWAEQISNSYIFLFDTEPPKQLLKYNVNMFDRNSDSFANEIARLFL